MIGQLGVAEEKAPHAGSPGQIEVRDASVFLDVSTLMEGQWTGIPTVAAGLAEALLALLPNRLHFFLGPDLVRREPVLNALRQNSGLFLEREIASGRGLDGSLAWLSKAGTGHGASIGIYPSVKPVRRAFTVECSVFHDLSALVLPYLHIKGNVDHHMEAMLADIASSDVIVAVSASTAEDLSAYLGVQSSKIVVAPNGVKWPAQYAVDAANALAPAGAEPYVLILGTREPRKNVLLVFEMLQLFPALLGSHRFVFAGKMGWLEEQHAIPAALAPALAAGRILFTGFVSDAVKYRLLSGAQATLYPSIFEGFGLPVLESLSAGTPAVASWSSSIPEVGGDCCHYFDPLSAVDMARATTELCNLSKSDRVRLKARCKAHAAGFTWHQAASAILVAAGNVLNEQFVTRTT